MRAKQGDLALLQHPTSQELLHSKIPARLAYVWTDGTPRVIPIWFHWNGRELVMGTPSKAPKLKALAKNPKVSLTIDNNEFPHKVLLVRGTARLETVKSCPSTSPQPIVTSNPSKPRLGWPSFALWFPRWFASPLRRNG